MRLVIPERPTRYIQFSSPSAKSFCNTCTTTNFLLHAAGISPTQRHCLVQRLFTRPTTYTSNATCHAVVFCESSSTGMTTNTSNAPCNLVSFHHLLRTTADNLYMMIFIIYYFLVPLILPGFAPGMYSNGLLITTIRRTRSKMQDLPRSLR